MWESIGFVGKCGEVGVWESVKRVERVGRELVALCSRLMRVVRSVRCARVMCYAFVAHVLRLWLLLRALCVLRSAFCVDNSD